MSPIDIIILILAIAAVVGGIVYAVCRRGKTSCGGDCTHCGGCDRKRR